MKTKFKVGEPIFYYCHGDHVTDLSEPRLDIKAGVIAHIDEFPVQPYYHINILNGKDLQMIIVGEDNLLKGISEIDLDVMVNL